MKFLVDNALPPLLAELLVISGQDAVHVRAYNMQAASDEAILARALAEGRIVVSADTDFGAILANQVASHPSFVLFRDPNLLAAADYATMLIPALSLLEPELTAGCVAVFEMGDCGFADCHWPDYSLSRSTRRGIGFSEKTVAPVRRRRSGVRASPGAP